VTATPAAVGVRDGAAGRAVAHAVAGPRNRVRPLISRRKSA